jgi:hypothetical protein
VQVDAETAVVRAALERVDWDGCDLVVVVSPHAHASGVYAAVRGDLASFGIDDGSFARSVDRDAARDVATAWERVPLDGAADHGVGVPILAGVVPDVPVVAVGMAEGAPPRDAIAAAHKLAGALGRLWGEVGLVCSAHTSAALSPAAPLTEKPEGRALDTMILEALNTDCGLLADLPPDLWDAGGSCGAGPMTCFGALFGGATATVACYEHPFGVGYLVATATP